MDAPGTRHVFAALAAPPYRILRVEMKRYQAGAGAPVQPGASCDHCGTAIVETYTLQGSDGRTFKVGNVCIGKTGDRGLVDRTTVLHRRIEREQRHAREAERIAAARTALQDPSTRARLEAEPHPCGFSDRETGRALTRLDWAEWMMAHAGTSGRLQVARALEGGAK